MEGSVHEGTSADGVIDRACKGDSTAWGSLVARHLGVVHAICRAFGLDSLAAGEVNQAVWLRLAEHLPRIRTPRAVGPWIAATTRSECLQPIRAPQRSGWVAGGLSVRLDDGADPGLMADSVTVGRCFARMGATCQRLLRLASVQPPPGADLIAAALDLPTADVPGTCRSCWRRLEHLMRSAGGQGGSSGASGAPRPPDQVIASSDPVPRSWWNAAEAAFGWLCIDAVTADVVYDSLEALSYWRPATRYGAVVRHDGARKDRTHRGTRRLLRFSAGLQHVDVTVNITADTRDYAEVLLTGRVDPMGSGRPSSGDELGIVARWPGGSAPAAVGPDGEFRLSPLPLAPLSVEVGARAPTPAVKTGWIFP